MFMYFGNQSSVINFIYSKYVLKALNRILADFHGHYRKEIDETLPNI